MKQDFANLRGELRGRDDEAARWASFFVTAVAESDVCLNAEKCGDRILPDTGNMKFKSTTREGAHG